MDRNGAFGWSALLGLPRVCTTQMLHFGPWKAEKNGFKDWPATVKIN